MKRLLTAAVLVILLPLTATATADNCYPAEIGQFDSGSPKLVRPDVAEDATVRFDIVGTFLNVQLDDTVVSVEIPIDATGLTACESGQVTFTFPEIAEDAPSAPAPIVVDIIEMWRPWFPGSPV